VNKLSVGCAVTAASKPRPTEYSSQMPWRRITGSVLAALLLLANVLPAMCGECPKATRADICGESHGIVAAENRAIGSLAANAEKCASCADEGRNDAKRFAPQHAASDSRLLRGVAMHCSDEAVSMVLLAEPKYLTSHRDLSSPVASASSPGAVHKVFAAQQHLSISTNELSSNSTHPSFLVILKI
jgi:hypothetical protein